MNDDEEKVRMFVLLIVLIETLGVLESGGGKLLKLFEDGAGERTDGTGMDVTEGGGLCVFGVWCMVLGRSIMIKDGKGGIVDKPRFRSKYSPTHRHPSSYHSRQLSQA